ncbi:MAG: carbon-monoxide dehydrogenase, catalytic subunit [Anaerosporomusa subterranea]|jgi:hydroxylamine reductase (hybrid-cluster protein)|nr:carbon-monoxide dehydrogenase, catalytic subunit [Anaerosporomusa subterranea]
MKQVQKKSIDKAVNQMLLAARHRRIPLAWDRAETQQPQCGFGRLAICCNDCQEGPCRVNPFGDAGQSTICGRERNDLVSRYLLNKAADGALALAKLADEYGGVGNELLRSILIADDEMLLPRNYDERLIRIGQDTAEILATICQSKHSIFGNWQPGITETNLGILQADAINIVLHGHVPSRVVAGIKAAAEGLQSPVVFGSICGNEWSGGFSIPALTNYDSQETPLLTGAVDLLIVGSQCVMPAVVRLADNMGVAVSSAAVLKDFADYAAIADKAQNAFKRRVNKTPVIPTVKTQVDAGYTADNTAGLFELLTEGHAGEKVKGVVYLGGCGSITNTQDTQSVALATAFIEEGYLIVTSGCAGVALAKAGMCQPDWNDGQYKLKSVLPDAIPPVINVGSCQDAGEFLRMAKCLKQNNIPLAAIFPEVNHNKVLATAISFAVAGIDSWMGLDPVFADSAITEWLNTELFAKVGARVMPLAEPAEMLQILAETASAR